MRINVRTQSGPKVTIVKRTERFAEGDLLMLDAPTISGVLEELLIGLGLTPEQISPVLENIAGFLAQLDMSTPTTSAKAIRNIDQLMGVVFVGIIQATFMGGQIGSEIGNLISVTNIDGLDLDVLSPSRFQARVKDMLIQFGSDEPTAEQVSAGTAQVITPFLGDVEPTQINRAVGNLAKLALVTIVSMTSVQIGLNHKADIDGDTGKLRTDQLPPLAITSVRVAGSEAEMLSGGGEEGDVVVRSDIRKTFILSTGDSTDLNNWVPFECATDGVATVNGETGDVVIPVSIEKKSAQYTMWLGRDEVPLDALTVGIDISQGTRTVIIPNPPPGHWTEVTVGVSNHGGAAPYYLSFDCEFINHWPLSDLDGGVPIQPNTERRFRLVINHGETGAVVDAVEG